MKSSRKTLLVAAIVVSAFARAAGQAPAERRGIILSWGENGMGQLGMGGTTPPDWRRHAPFNPAAVPSLSKITGISAGTATAAAIDEAGGVWVWGMTLYTPVKNGEPQLGTPVKIPDLSNVIAVSVGDISTGNGGLPVEHGLALKADGTVWAWGSNVLGELGKEQPAPGRVDVCDKPFRVPNLEGVCAIAAGTLFSLALKSDGTVWAWGNNQVGQLGDGTFDRSAVAHPRPAPVPNLKAVKAIAVGTVSCLALDSQGAVWTWGMNARGVLARPVAPLPDPPPSTREALEEYAHSLKCPSPRKIAGLPPVKSIASGGLACLAVSVDGRVWTWGHQVPRRLTEEEMRKGNVKPENNELVIDKDSDAPVVVEGLTDLVAVSVGGLNYMALKSDGTVWGWGTGNYRVGMKDEQAVADLPLNEFARRMVTPIQVPGVKASAISAGGGFFLACSAAPQLAYLDWFRGFSMLLRDRSSRINDDRAVAAGLALPLDNARRAVARLDRAIKEADRARREGEPTAVQAVVDRLREKFKTESDLCQLCLRHLDEVTADGRSAIDDVLAALKPALDAYKDNDVQARLLYWRDHFEAAAKELPMEMALAARDDDAILDEVQKRKTETLPVGAQVKIGNHLLLQGELADALFIFRSALRADPGNADARDGLARAEAGAMRLSLSKSAGALAEARSAFYRLIDSTGYSDRPYQPDDWDWLVTESWETLFHLPVNLADIVFGRTRAEQTKLRAEELELVRNLLVVPVIIRLRLRGHTLEEIPRMSRQALREALPLKTITGRPYSDEEMNKLRAQMRKAMDIGDLAVLAKKDATLEDLRRDLARPLVGPEDMPDTSPNEFGAAMTENVIMLALPMARLTRGGAAVTELLGQITRYEKAVRWFGGTENGQRLLRGLQQYQEFQAALIRAGTWSGRARFGLIKGGELMAMLMVQGYAIELAGRAGGETAAAVTSALVMMVGDLDLLTRWLAAGKIARETALGIMDAAILQAKRAIEEKEENARIIEHLRALKQRKESGATFSPQDSEYVKRYRALAPDFFPTGDPLHDSQVPRSELAKDASSGADRGAEKCCREFGDDVAKDRARLTGEAEQARAARKKLAEAPEPADAAAPPAGAGRLAGKPAPEAWKDNGGYLIPDGPVPGSNWARAEEAMRDGYYDGAKDLFQRAHDEGEISDVLLDALTKRAEEAMEAGRPVPGVKQNTSAEFAPGQVEDILRRKWDKKTPLPRSDPQSIGQAYQYADETGSYILKEVKLNSENADSLIDCAVVSSRLMDELGIPNSRVGVTILDEGGDRSLRFLIRRIDGQDMLSLKSGELFQYRKELSEQRAFSLLIRDYDRKPPNSFLGKDGRVYYIDADMGHLFEDAPTSPGMLEGRGAQDHWYWRSNEGMKNPAGTNAAERAAYLRDMVKYNLAERALTANDAQPMVRRINALLDPGNETRLRGLLTRAFRDSRGPKAVDAAIQELVNRTIRTMRARAEKIPDVLKLLNERNGIPLPPGGWNDPPPDPDYLWTRNGMSGERAMPKLSMNKMAWASMRVSRTW